MATAKGKPVRVRVRSTEVQRKFGEVLRRAHSGREHIIVEFKGFPVVAMLSMAEYEALMREHDQRERDKQQRLKQFEEAARAIGEEIEKLGLTEEELMQHLEDTRQRLFEERHAKRTE